MTAREAGTPTRLVRSNALLYDALICAIAGISRTLPCVKPKAYSAPSNRSCKHLRLGCPEELEDQVQEEEAKEGVEDRVFGQASECSNRLL